MSFSLGSGHHLGSQLPWNGSECKPSQAKAPDEPANVQKQDDRLSWLSMSDNWTSELLSKSGSSYVLNWYGPVSRPWILSVERRSVMWEVELKNARTSG